MSRWRKDIKKLSSSKNPLSFWNWIQVLNFFEEHKNDLDIGDLELIVKRSEENRLYVNEEHGSGIEQCEVRPDVYLYLEHLKEEKRRSDTQVQNSDNLIACHQ